MEKDIKTAAATLKGPAEPSYPPSSAGDRFDRLGRATESPSPPGPPTLRDSQSFRSPASGRSVIFCQIFRESPVVIDSI